MPKVSVVIPVYNVAKFLPECLDSAISQTLEEIEIICVNDGSTDGSLAILKEYAASDNRIRIIDKQNEGYGVAMNVGIAEARGKYIAILESDDRIELNAYERLFTLAEKNRVDIIKGDYYFLEGMGEQSQLEYKAVSPSKRTYDRILRPLKKPWTFNLPMMNWMGLIKREFLENNGIVHNKTPGASHQDVGFWFNMFCAAKRLMYVQEPFYMYRQDNMNSSMKDDKTAFFVKDEFRFIKEYLEQHPQFMRKALPVYCYRKFSSCMFAYENASEEIKLSFLEQLSEEFNLDEQKGILKLRLFDSAQKARLDLLMKDPVAFYETKA